MGKDAQSISALSANTEKFKTISINRFSFIDSMSFLQGSLAELVDNLHKSGAEFKTLDQWGAAKNPDKKNLLLRKGKNIFIRRLMIII